MKELYGKDYKDLDCTACVSECVRDAKNRVDNDLKDYKQRYEELINLGILDII